ncbi:hypothetical protein JCM10207_003362 [Rhodosporidiobolus poonsookiae]
MSAAKGSLTSTTVVLPAPSTTRGQPTKLGASADGNFISYGAGRTAILRPLFAEETGLEPRLFTHTASVTVCKAISPYFAASGDTAGNLKVWDSTGNYSLKLESKPIARINDLAVDGEGKRIVVVGEGRSGWGASFSLDTGSSIGEITGHSKVVNAVAMRAQRPFRAATGSDDFSVCLLNGVPFKFASQSRRHTRFVQSLDYAPSGALFVSAGSDGQVLLYDGQTGEEKGALVEGSAAHEKGVFAASFSRDSKTVATSSADRTVKLWDVESQKVVRQWQFDGDEVEQQQVGNVFAGSTLVSLSHSGDLNILDPQSASPVRTLYGHQNPVTALAVAPTTFDTFVSGDSAGRVLATRIGGERKQETSKVNGPGHAGLVVGITPTGSGEEFASAAYDDTVKQLNAKEFQGSSIPAGAQPKSLAASSNSTLFLATATSLDLIASGRKVASVAVPLPPLSVASTPGGDLAAVGAEDSKVYLYSRVGDNLKLDKTIELRSQATALAFAPDEKDGKHLLAVGLATGKLPLYDIKTGELVQSRWSDITARIQSLAFNAEGSHIAAASLDESVRVYSLAKPGTVLSLKNLHKGGASSVVWAGPSTLASTGADGAIRVLEAQLV